MFREAATANTEHRGTRLCAQSTAVHTPDPWLHSTTWLQPHHQVHRWYDCGGSHQQEWWVIIQRGGGTTDNLVQSQPPIRECRQNQRDGCWLPESTEGPWATEHPRLHSRDHEKHKIPWCPLGGELNLVPKNVPLWRKPSSVSTSWEGWEKPTSHPQFSPLSTEGL